jgi:purine-binding chemotaxis protein CheW
MDVRLRFKLKAKEYSDRTCIIIIEFSDILIGLIVDSVSEVITIPEQNIQEPPQMSKNAITDI